LKSLEKHVEKSNDELGEKIKSVKQGEEVYLPSLNQKVIVISKPDRKGEVQVQAGIMKINVKLDDLRVSKLTDEDKKKAKIIKERDEVKYTKCINICRFKRYGFSGGYLYS